MDADLNVVVLEKGSEVGAHILSGAVLDPVGLDKLIPDWKEKGAPLNTPVTEDKFYMLGEAGQIRVPNWPMPSLMDNHGNYIVSMGNVCRWMAEQAEELGVEIFPGMACSEMVYGDNGEVKGVVAGVFGLEADGSYGPNTEPGMELLGKYVFLSEGVRGSLAKEVIAKYDLQAGKEPQKFGIGMKEIWDIDPAKHKAGSRLCAPAHHERPDQCRAPSAGSGYSRKRSCSGRARSFETPSPHRGPWVPDH